MKISFLGLLLSILLNQAQAQFSVGEYIWGDEEFVVSQLTASNVLSNPYDMHYGPDDWLWVTERWGHRMLRIHAITGAIDVLHDGSGIGRMFGMALHPRFGIDNHWVYVALIANSEYKVVRYDYTENQNNGSLTNMVVILGGLTTGPDHVSGRLAFGPDDKLYLTCGDLLANHASRQCDENKAQFLPTQGQVDAADYPYYIGKILRINPDGSIPGDNPVINGVQSHIFSFGHRNPQGLVIGSNNRIYSSEHGPATDDEINLIKGGNNYGWPYIAGFRDDANYTYCNRSSNSNCQDNPFDVFNCPDGAENTLESAWPGNFQSPLASLFVVTDPNDLSNNCDVEFICRPGIAPSNLIFYDEGSNGMTGWGQSLMVASLKTGSVYRFRLNDVGDAVVGQPIRYFNTVNRYRDIVVGPDNKTFYMLTDNGGSTQTLDGSASTSNKDNPGTILKFTLKDPALYVERDSSMCKGSYITFGNLFITSSGSYTAIFKSHAGLDSTVVLNITINELPVVDLGSDFETEVGIQHVLDAGEGYASYLWSTGEATQTITIDNLEIGSYTYSVSVEDENGCEGSADIRVTVVEKPLVVATPMDQFIDPNLVKDFVHLRDADQVKSISIYSLTGNNLEDKYDRRGDVIDLRRLPAGVYFIKMVDMPGKTHVNRFVKVE